MFKVKVISYIVFIFGFNVISSIPVKSPENAEKFFSKRCDDNLSKEKADEYAKCDSEATQLIKDTVAECAKEYCNKNGNYSKLDICCYTVEPENMYNCFGDKVQASEAKSVDKEKLHQSNVQITGKIMECYAKQN